MRPRAVGETRALALGVVLAGSPGTSVPGWLADAIRDGLGGVILFAENTPDVATTRRLTDAMRACRPPAAAPLVIAVDEEGGDITRLQAREGSSLPGNAALGAVDDIDLTRRCGAALGRLLADAGVDLDLAPVLDVASDTRNPVVGTRSFGADAGLVARHGIAMAQGLAGHVSVCGKHYPGHGATRVDSHLALPVVRGSLATLEARDLAPFVALSRAGLLDAVMTGHLVVPALGSEPASLSRWATDRIRATGHEGAIITDALGMGAISGALGRSGSGPDGSARDRHEGSGREGSGREDSGHEGSGLGEACVRAIEAGADLVCLDAPHQRDAQAALVEAVDAIEAGLASGRLSPHDLRRSAGRVARLARRSDERPGDDLAAQELEAVGLEAARRAVRTPGGARLALAGPAVVVDVRAKASLAAGRTGSTYSRVLASDGPDEVGVVALDSATQVEAALGGADECGEVVVLTRDPRGDAGERALLDAVVRARPRAIVVHLGVSATAPDGIERVVLGYGTGLANARAVGELLRGHLVAGATTAARPAREAR